MRIITEKGLMKNLNENVEVISGSTVYNPICGELHYYFVDKSFYTCTGLDRDLKLTNGDKIKIKGRDYMVQLRKSQKP